MLPADVFPHVTFDLAAVVAVGAFEARLEAALVLQVPVQIPFPIELPVAIGSGTEVGAGSQPPELPVSFVRTQLEIWNKTKGRAFLVRVTAFVVRGLARFYEYKCWKDRSWRNFGILRTGFLLNSRRYGSH